IQKYLTSECAEKLIHAFITSRLDYYNSLLYGVPGHHMQKLQRVMNACYSRAQLLNISVIEFLFTQHPIMIYREITREFFSAPQSVRQRSVFGTVFP
ncbi:unnamed protein product, partial [Pocillopora meandrina]